MLARKSATPHLKPVITLSEMKFTMTPAFTSHAMKRDQRDKQSGSRRECAKARCIAARDLAKRRANEQRDRGSDRDDCVPRTTKQPEDESTKQARVKSSLGRQIGQRGVAQTGGQQVCGECDTGGNIAAKPASVVMAQPD